MDFVDEQHRARLLLELGKHRLQALFEITAILRTGDQRTEIERVDGATAEHLGHLTLNDSARQTLGDRRLADTGLTNIERIVLAATTEDLDRALDLEFATDQRIDLALLGELVEVAGVLLERTGALGFRCSGPCCGRLFLRASFVVVGLRHAVRDVIDHIEARHILATEQKHRMALLLAEDGDEHVRHGDFLAAARLHVEYGAL